MTMKRMQEHSNSNPAKKRQRQGRQPMSTKKEDTQNAQTSEVLLRQENQLKCLSLDHEFNLHIGSGEGGILAEMAAQTAQWHGEGKTGPLRWKLAQLVMKTINLRLNQLALCKRGSESCFFFARCCLGQVPGGAPFSQRSELATACTSRMQIKSRTKRIDKASKAKQSTNWNQKVIRCVQTHARKREASRNTSGRGYL